jgi:hypothetical protein
MNAYCLPDFQSLFSPFSPFSHFFPSLPIPFSVNFYVALKIAVHASNKCILPIFLSVTFHALRALFRPFFRRFRPFSVNFLSLLKLLLPASNKCILPIFPSLFPLFSALFSAHLNLAFHASNNLYDHLSFRPFSRPSRPFRPFFRGFLSLFPLNFRRI